ncbi:MAG TPA: DUF4215 domain-containing protein [Kofleriaceae bacterium]
MKRLTNLLAMLTLATACVGNTGSNEQRASEHSDAGPVSGNCTLTQGYWKNHEEAWPVTTIMLGSVSYTQAEALAVFRTPVKGNGLVALAHQLLAAKLNIEAGADDIDINSAIADADAMIGALVSPSVGTGHLETKATADLVGALDAFNNGATGPGHCDDNPPPPPPPACGNGVLEDDEQCDDGNTTSGDGCSATCTTEPPPPCSCCGDGVVEGEETCDDGNTTSGDGCSATCTTEASCGNGVVEGTEQCDDGNTTSGDGCSATCTTEAPPPCECCGDGIVDALETCDDGNAISGDGCSSACVTEQVQ